MNSNEKKVIYLRGHHLLCLQGYQGYGYDDNFKKNMENIINILKNEDSNVKVVLTESPDVLCEFCPNLKDKICIGESNNTEINENIKGDSNIEYTKNIQDNKDIKDTKSIENTKNIKYNKDTKNKLMHSINNKKIVSMDSKVLKKAKINKKKEYLFSYIGQ